MTAEVDTQEAPKVTNEGPRVGVLIVHGVNAPVPDPDFSTLKAVASLLENHDFKKDGFYTPSSVTQFSIPVTGVPPVPSNLDQPGEQIDRGNAVMIEAIKDFKTEQSYWDSETTRNETLLV